MKQNKLFLLIALFIFSIFFIFYSSSSTSASGNSFPGGIGGNLIPNKFTNVSRFGKVSRFGEDAPPGQSGVSGSPPEQPGVTGSPPEQQTLPTSWPPNGPSESDMKLVKQKRQPIEMEPGDLTKAGFLDQYQDGTYLSPLGMMTPVMTVFPDGNPVPIQQQLFFLTYNLRMNEKRMPTNYSGPNMDQMMKINTQDDMNTFIKSVTNKDMRAYLTEYAYAVILLFGSNIFNFISWVAKNASTYTPMIYFINSCLNIDLFTGKTSVGNGWDQYSINSLNVSSDTPLITSPVITYDQSPIKSILLKYKGYELGSTTSVIKVIVNGTTTLSTDTSFQDDRTDYNYNIYCLPLDYPITLSSLTMTLTCPGTNAGIDDAIILIVYQ